MEDGKAMNTSKWGDVQCSFAYSCSIVKGVGGNFSHVFRAEVRKANGSKTERAELSRGSKGLNPFGSELWISFKMYIPKDWARGKSVIVKQMHAGPGRTRPITSLSLGDEGEGLRLVIGKVYTEDAMLPRSRQDDRRASKSADFSQLKGRWIKVVEHYKFGKGDAGLYEVYLDDASQPLFRAVGNTGFMDDTRGSYSKLGIYAGAMGNGGTGYASKYVMYYDDYREGPTRASVAR